MDSMQCRGACCSRCARVEDSHQCRGARPLRLLLLSILLAGACAEGPIRLSDRIDTASDEVEIGGERRLALTSVLGERVEVEIDLPPAQLRPHLEFSTAVGTERPAARARVAFRVRIISDGFPVTVHDETVRLEGHNQWEDHSVDLAAWAGKRVTLDFETYPATSAGEVPWAERVRAIWGDPVIASHEAREKTSRSPSVILVVVDALRYDYLGVNGFDGEISPNLDWLALESVRFESAITSAPWTKPSIASLLTGLHPQSHGILKLHADSGEVLPEQALTLAEVFRANGYRTAGFVGNALLSSSYGFRQGFETYVVDRRDEVLLDELRSWLASAGDAPYFVYLHLIGVHAPYRAPEPDYRLLRESRSLRFSRKVLPTDPRRPDHLDSTPFASAHEVEDLGAWKAKYAATVRQVDRRLGTLVNELRRSGDLDRGFLVLTADHGEEFLEHPSWEHGYGLCAHQLHVPLWLRMPGAEGAGTRITDVVSLVDLMPTLLRLSRLPVPVEAQGQDRSQWITRPFSNPPSYAFASGMLGNGELHSLWTDGYRFEWNAGTNAVRLFDRNRDPAEVNDIALLDPELAAGFKETLRIHLEKTSGAVALESELLGIPRELREELRALGYVRD